MLIIYLYLKIALDKIMLNLTKTFIFGITQYVIS